jgi:hypothetical protein
LSSTTGFLPVAGLIVLRKGNQLMKQFFTGAVLSLFLAVALTPASALADSRAHRSAIKMCKQRYKSAIRGAKYLKHRQRMERIEQARRDRAECERLAPK